MPSGDSQKYSEEILKMEEDSTLGRQGKNKNFGTRQQLTGYCWVNLSHPPPPFLPPPEASKKGRKKKGSIHFLNPLVAEDGYVSHGVVNNM